MREQVNRSPLGGELAPALGRMPDRTGRLKLIVRVCWEHHRAYPVRKSFTIRRVLTVARWSWESKSLTVACSMPRLLRLLTGCKVVGACRGGNTRIRWTPADQFPHAPDTHDDDRGT